MKTSSYSLIKVKKNFTQFFDNSVLNKLSVKTGFSRRKARKITASAFVMGFIECSLKKCYSYLQWAAAISRITGKSVSKQSLFERINKGASALSEALLEHVIQRQIARVWNPGIFTSFKKVLLQDSTTLSLPDELCEYFPGNISRGVQKAVARIGCILELKTMQFLHFALSGYTKNDQSSSKDVTAIINKADLVIRDLGYFTVSSLQAIADKKAHFLSRLRWGVNMYDQNEKLFSVQKYLRLKRPVDRWLWIGEKCRLPVRLVMVPLPSDIVAERKRRARKDRDRRLNHSKAYYEWLGYNCFITNVGEHVWSTRQVAEAYKVRWQIEMIFKSWKSGFNLESMLKEQFKNVHRIITAIFLMLVFICLFVQKIYRHFTLAAKRTKGKTVSLLKLSKYVASNLYFVFSASHAVLLEQIAKYCCYEKRTDRINMTELIQLFKN